MGSFTFWIGLFYITGFGVLGYGLWSAIPARRAANWPTTAGMVTSVLLKRGSDDDGPTFEVKVEYTYSVNGRTYQGSHVAFGYGSSHCRTAHEEIFRKLKEADTVEVRFDPWNPETSVLSCGVHHLIQGTLAFGIAWLAFAIGVHVLWWLS